MPIGAGGRYLTVSVEPMISYAAYGIPVRGVNMDIYGVNRIALYRTMSRPDKAACILDRVICNEKLNNSGGIFNGSYNRKVQKGLWLTRAPRCCLTGSEGIQSKTMLPYELPDDR